MCSSDESPAPFVRFRVACVKGMRGREDAFLPVLLLADDSEARDFGSQIEISPSERNFAVGARGRLSPRTASTAFLALEAGFVRLPTEARGVEGLLMMLSKSLDAGRDREEEVAVEEGGCLVLRRELFVGLEEVREGVDLLR